MDVHAVPGVEVDDVAASDGGPADDVARDGIRNLDRDASLFDFIARDEIAVRVHSDASLFKEVKHQPLDLAAVGGDRQPVGIKARSAFKFDDRIAEPARLASAVDEYWIGEGWQGRGHMDDLEAARLDIELDGVGPRVDVGI
jgi:hypothetical protein